MIKLTRKQRMYGFFYSMGIGLVVSMAGVIAMGFHHITAFAICYSIGTVLSLAASCFLWGPWYQIKNMFKAKRWVCTIIMLASIALTLVAALVWDNVALCVVFATIQFCAVFWYGLSYIPYARKMATSCFKSCISFE